MRVEGTGRLVKQAILLIVITLLFLISIQGLPGEHSIQTDKLQYTIGETVYVTVIDANINQQNLYYEYEGFSQRYMGDYTSFSFAPVGIGTHNLVLRDKGGNEITRASFEVIAGEEQKPTEEQPVEQPPTEQPQEPTLPEMPVVPQPSQGITPELKPIKQAFKQQENPEFNLSYEPKQKIIFPEKLKQKGTWQTARETIKAEVFDSSGNKQDILPDIERIEDGKFKITIPSQRAFRPGKYSLKTELTTGGNTYVEEQDFLWGVLALNTQKSIYLPDEQANIGMAVLDDNGKMVCNANVTLQITAPDGSITILSTSDGTISISPECPFYGVTNLPDYYANYNVAGIGNYTMNLTAQTSNGIRNIVDSFMVQENVDYDVARNGPTRIYPPVPYKMGFTIKANKDYSGVIKEYVPADFVVTSQPGLTTSIVNGTQILQWNAELAAGQTYDLSYEFDAPDISPYLFTLGPLQVGDWQEQRNWMIASDYDQYNVMVNFSSNSTWAVPAGVSWVLVEAWGGGGAGGNGAKVSGTSYGGGGGAGGQYARENVTVSAGQIFNITVAPTRTTAASAGSNTTFWNSTNSTIVRAVGGAGGATAVSANGAGGNGSTLNGVGDTIYAGGNGASGSTSGGGGGGGAGSSASGGNASGATAGAGGIGNPVNGSGGAGGTNGVAGKNYSGGGGGGYGSGGTGGGGAQGFMKLTYNLIDSVAPIVNINTSRNNTLITGTASIEFNFTDSISSTANCTLYFNSTGFNYTTGINKDIQTTLTANASVSAGRYDVWINCTDESNNVNKSSVLNISLDPPPAISNAAATPRFVVNGTTVNISATVTDNAVSTVIARILYPNGTSAANYTMTNSSGSIYWNATYTSNFGIPGQYNITIFANDSASSSVTAQTYFTPVLNLSNSANISINGSFTDWSDASVPVIGDVVGDSGTGGVEVIDNELVITGLNNDPGNITIFNWTGSSYEIIWSTDTAGVTYSVGGGEVGDVNHDGVDDFLITGLNTNWRAYVWFYNSSSSDWDLLWDAVVGGTSTTVRTWVGDIGDFDNDTFTEFLLFNENSDTVEVWGNDSVNASSFSLEKTVKSCATLTYIGSAGDLDNDSFPEIIFQCTNDNVIDIYEYNPGSGNYESVTTITEPESMFIDDMECGKDLNRDNVPDCVFCGNSIKSHILTYSGGAYTIAYNSSSLGAGFTQSCSPGDYDGNDFNDWFDGGQSKAIRFFSHSGSAYQSVWNSSVGSGTSYSIGGSFGGDSDNDGIDEMFAVFYDGSSLIVVLYENDTVEATTFANTFNFSVSGTSTQPSIMVGDLDGDSSSGGGGGGDNYDITNISLAHNNTYLFARLSVNGSIDFSTTTNYYALYLSTNDASTGSQYAASGGLLPFLYDYRIQVNNSNCTIYNYTNQSVGGCNMSNSTNTIELRANLTLINMTSSSVVNITFETGGSSSFDMAPDYNSFLQYSATAGGGGGGNNPPTLDAYDTYPDSPYTGDDLVFNITCGDSDGGDTITAYLQIFNGSASFKNYSQTVTASVETTLWIVGNLNTTKGNNWNGSYWCGNGTVNTTKAYDNVTILNTAPTNPSSLSLSAVNVSSTLTGGCGGSSDVDGDSVSYNYYFYNVNDSSQLQAWSATATYTVQSTDAHNMINVTCKATTTDANSSGNYTNSTSVDDSHPTLPTLDKPADLNITNDNTPYFNWTASTDADGDSITYAIQIDDDSGFSSVDQSDYAVATNAYTATSLTDKAWYWHVKAVTSYENSSYTSYRTLTIDATPPTVNAILPANNNITNINTPNFFFNYTDTLSPNASCTLYVGSTAYGSNASVLNYTQTNITANSAISDGTYSWNVTCADFAGNTLGSTARVVTIDTALPTVNINTSKNNTVFTTATPSFNFNYSDSLSLNASCSLYFDSSSVNTNSSTQNWTNTVLTSSSKADANYSVNISCSDQASNIGKSGRLNIEIDTAAPIITNIANDSITSSSARINWTTNEEANSSVKYGEDAGLTTGEEVSSSLAPAHSISLSGLSPSTLYYYNITSCDAQGWCNITGPYNFTTSAPSNNPPIIDSVDTVPSQTPIAEDVNNVPVNFTVTDTDGEDNLNHSSAKAVFTKNGITRTGNCSNNTIDSDSVKYNCSVPMQYYDPAGSWAINVSVFDLANAYANNTQNTFDFQELLYISLSSTVFGFGEFFPGDTNQAALSNPLLIDNMGNVNLTHINITAYNLANGSYIIGVSNITVNVSDAPGIALQNNSMVVIPYANVSVDIEGVDANESLYFYISIPAVPALNYSSSNDWVISADK